jgi:hypothetical protein
MNANAFHAILNYLGLIVGILALQDWTAFGIADTLAVKLVAGFVLLDKILKVTINIARDGFAGQFKVQPPVSVIAAIVAVGLILSASPGAAVAAVVCNPIAKMKGLKDTGAEPVFLARGGKGVGYAIYGKPDTGEWIAFVVVENQDKACNVANGFGYSIVVPDAKK